MTQSNQSFFKRVVEWWAKRQAAKEEARWTPEMQLEHLRLLLETDSRWMAHVRLVNSLTNRYLNALEPDWFRRNHVSSDKFRKSQGLEPTKFLIEPTKVIKGARAVHVKSGGEYEVVEVANMEADQTLVVVYRSLSTGQVWVRPYVEFSDGRFSFDFDEQPSAVV